MTTQKIIDHIFKDPKVKYDLVEFSNLPKPIEQIITIYPKVITSGKDTGQEKYFLKSFVSFNSGTDEIQVYDPKGKSNPEEIVRQLWIYKLINQYQYKKEQIIVEKPIAFGSDTETKKADILVTLGDALETAKIVFEIKKPNRKDGIEQLKSYLNAQGSPIGVWSNGSERIILYRPYPKEFNDTLAEIPRSDQEAKDVFEATRTLATLRKEFNFKKILESLEELVLADSGQDAFDEIFKIIFAKIYDEMEAEYRPNKEVLFRKMADPSITRERITDLFKKATEKWPGIFKETDTIELKEDHLSVCIGPIEPVRLMGSNLRIMDDAFEHLIPQVAKKKQGQFFTPRFVIDMCVRMLNPKPNEYVLDPACGSSGFLLHAMDWAFPISNTSQMENRKHKYAAKYLWGIDFAKRTVQTSKALMLIAGDGHTNIFGPDVSSLNPKDWFTTRSGKLLIEELRKARLLKKMPPHDRQLTEEDAWEYLKELKFDVILTNPPFAGEIKDRKLLQNYSLAKNALKRAKDKEPKEERDVLFIERIIDMLRPGGRAAIVLPQGKFNNSSLAFIREYILHKARLLAVVGLHQNTFKPHTGTKTSVLFIQKYNDEELKNIKSVNERVAANCPNYKEQIETLLTDNASEFDIAEDKIPQNIFYLMEELFSKEEELINGDDEEATEEKDTELKDDAETVYDKLQNDIIEMNNHKSNLVTKLENINLPLDALTEKFNNEKAVIEKENKDDKKQSKLSVKELKDKFKTEEKAVKEKIKNEKKSLTKEIVNYSHMIDNAIYEQKLLTNKGKLQIIIEDADSLNILINRYIDAEVVKELDYPIFMAVSENGGKDNSGDYVPMRTKEGNLIEDENGLPRIMQDLVNYEISKTELIDSSFEKFELIHIAEEFVKFAKKNNFQFWS